MRPGARRPGNPSNIWFLDADCQQGSRCHVAAYINSKKLLSPDEAELLQDAIKRTYIYKHPEFYILGGNTTHVESGHRIQNIYRDKSTHLSPPEYELRIDLSTLHWNELAKNNYSSGERTAPLQVSTGRVGLPAKKKVKRSWLQEIVEIYSDKLTQD